MIDKIVRRIRNKHLVPEPLRTLLIQAHTRRPYPRALVCGCGAFVMLNDKACPGCGCDVSRCAPLRRIA